MPSTVNRHNEWAYSTITAGACDILKKPTPLPNLIINYYTLNSAIRAYGLSLQCTPSNDRNILSVRVVIQLARVTGLETVLLAG